MADQKVHRSQCGANPDGSAKLRHDFDTVRALPEPLIRVRAPRLNERSEVLAMLTAWTGGPPARPEVFATVLDRDPESMWLFDRQGRIVGGIAFLHLLPKGMQQLIAGTIDLQAPDQSLLCTPGQRPAGIYVWALFGRGRAGTGVSRAIEHLQSERFRKVDLWAIPHDSDGQRFFRCLGFRPAFAETAEIFRYLRSEPCAS